ncbi:DNA polymerase III subunit gamma/tau, partial [Mesorhizobium sp. M5C.F.Ca.IN.020.14.1.1]
FNHLVTRLRFVPTALEDASLSVDERRRGADFAKALSVRVLSRTWQMLLKGIPEVQSSNRPVSAAEMVLIRLAHAADLPTLDEALKSLESGASVPNGAPRSNGAPASSVVANPGPASPGNGGASAVAQTRMPTANGGAQIMRLVEPAAMPAAFVPEPVADAPPVPVKSLADIVALADAQRDMAIKVLVKRCVRLVRIEPGRIDVSLTDDAPKMLLNDLTAKLRAWTGRSWLVSLSKEEGGQTLAEMESTKRESALLDAKSDPTVAAILARFPGAKIIDVRIPDAPEADAVEAEVPIEPATDEDET